MTTEETELTFVRCPSCRSLVPAVATRCRMCGYSFESGAESEEAEDVNASQSKSRVRQRTISATREQLDEISSGAIATDESFEDSTPVAPPSLFPTQEVDDFSPIAADPFASSGEFDDESDGDQPEVRSTLESKSKEPKSGDSVMESFSAAIIPLKDEAEAGDDANAKNVGIAVDEPSVFNSETDKPFIERADDDTGQEVSKEASEEVSAVEESSTEEGSTEESSSEEPVKKKRRRRRRRKSAAERVEQEEVTLKEEEVEMSSSAQKEKPMKSKSVVSASSGVLVGWFVTFAGNPKGEAEELRSGKFFIGRQQLREDDMVIDTEGVSTPHCLVAVESDGSLKIQDLMSENGTLIQRAGSDEFEAITDVANVEHGDKLRLGSYEVTICLLPR